MKVNALLEQIWGGAVSAWKSGEKGDIARGIAALLPVETICLSNAAPHLAPRILPESTELSPGLCLGDVLAEELGLTVPFGAVIVFEEVGNTPEVPVRDDEMLYEATEALRHVAKGWRDTPSARAADQRQSPVFRDDGLNARFFGAFQQAESVRKDGDRHLSRGDRAVG